jgi:Protein of unknown function (DUF1566)
MIQNTKKITIALFICLVSTALYAAPFTDNNDGTVTDTRTNLSWQKCNNGQNYAGGACTGTIRALEWKSALTYCRNLGLAGKNWRLPSLNELKSLTDRSMVYGIDTSYFPVTLPAAYVSASTAMPLTTHAWIILYASNPGTIRSQFKTGYAHSVRCVALDP